MKKTVLVGILATAFAFAIFTGCNEKEINQEAATVDVQTEDVVETEEINKEENETETEPEDDNATEEEHEESEIEEEPTETHTCSFAYEDRTYTIPSKDNSYVEMMEEAGLIEKGKYTGSFVTVFNSEVAAVAMNTDNPELDFGHERRGSVTDAQVQQYLNDFRSELEKYKNGTLEAVDFDGDGEVTLAEQSICAVFTCGRTFKGIFTCD